MRVLSRTAPCFDLVEKENGYLLEAEGPEIVVTYKDGLLTIDGIRRCPAPRGPRKECHKMVNGRRFTGRIPGKSIRDVKATYESGKLSLRFAD